MSSELIELDPFDEPRKINKYKNYKSSYVLMTTKKDNESYVMIVKESNSEHWTFFGGSQKPEDDENLYKTAARELWEESYGLYCKNKEECEQLLKNRNPEPFGINFGNVYLKYDFGKIGTENIFNQLINWFQTCNSSWNFMKGKPLEILEVAWIPWEILKHTINVEFGSRKKLDYYTHDYGLAESKTSFPILYNNRFYQLKKRTGWDLYMIIKK